MPVSLPSAMKLMVMIAIGLLFIPVARADFARLLDRYQQLQRKLETGPFGIPVSVESSAADHRMLGIVYGVIDQPFAAVRHALVSPQSWCDIVAQHFNIKACTNAQYKHECRLTIYAGRKYYENAEDVYRFRYRFDIAHADPDYVQTTLSADNGPMGTSHYRIEAEAIPLTARSSFLHFRYTYRYNWLTSLGMKTYLAILGHAKVGFSVTGTDRQGKPVYIDGVRGIIERNTIRYYFAIQSYLETLNIEPDNRFTARINKWFDLTERYPQQLHELEKSNYLQYKQHEHANQLRLQHHVQQPCVAAAIMP